jgi:hypothetical protein
VKLTFIAFSVSAFAQFSGATKVQIEACGYA